MEHNFLHKFSLHIEGLTEPVTFETFHELEDISEVTDAIAKYIARQEDDFLPLGATSAVRASKVLRVTHVSFSKA
ncbi:MAG: hypothetical protein ABIT01_10905 [Thermoanaerobaculia bacterium]